ncbi:cobaltochelatase subunit CobN [Mesorhizobium marinum]|uniref:cobaltochelatase subunit CobN n=1 Tax=Mesorhizobium marinum TaxID=3228790 RepID=UPI003465EE5C
MAAAWKAHAGALPSMRLAALRDLRHPMSVDLWVDSVATKAKVILVRILGGYDWWRYGCDQLAAAARTNGVKLALLPGECREQDERLVECSTLPRGELDALLSYFREGGPQNMAALVRRLAGLAGRAVEAPDAVEVPKAGFYDYLTKGIATRPPLACRASPPQGGRFAVPATSPIFDFAENGGTTERIISPLEGEMPGRAEGGIPPTAITAPTVPILFYRSMLLASDVAPIDALADALRARGLNPVPIFVASLKDAASAAFVETALRDLKPALIVTATAFAAGAEPGAETLFDRAGVPVMQAIVATTRREAWAKSPRGLAPADLAMHVVMPELDGRILAGALSFKGESEVDAELGFRAFANRPEVDRVEQVAARIAAMARLQATPRESRRVAILMPDYPGAAGRTGYAVGLDVPTSVLAMLHDLKDAGYAIDGIPETPRELLDLVEREGAGLSLEDYLALAVELPAEARQVVEAAWGSPGKSSSFAPPSGLPAISPSRGEIRGSGDITNFRLCRKWWDDRANNLPP